MSARTAPRDGLLVIAFAVPSVLIVALTATRSLEYGHFSSWWYWPDHAVTVKAVLVAALAGAGAALGTMQLRKLVEQREALAVAACCAAGFVLQLAVISTDSVSLRRIISDRDNDFLLAARRVNLGDLLRHFDTLRPNLPQHAGTNMPGKIALYTLLLRVSDNDVVLGYLVVAIAALGAVLVYLLARSIFDDRQTAIIAMVLYLVVPARLVFVLLANSITVVLVVGLFLAAVTTVRTGRVLPAIVTGVLCYALMFYEPTPVVLLPTFFVVAARFVPAIRATPGLMTRLVALATAAFLVVQNTMVLAFGFNVFHVVRFVARDAGDFNRRAHRDYLDFLLPNTREYLVHAGVISAITVVAAFLGVMVALVRRRQAIGDVVRDPVRALPLVLGATLLVLLLSGASRGEVSRLWIFLAVFFAIAAAGLFRQMPAWVVPAAVVVSVVQAILGTNTMGFIVPRTICHDCGLVPTRVSTPLVDAALILGITLASLFLASRSREHQLT